MDLQDIAHPIQRHLDAFPKIFRESLRSNVGLVELVTRYLVRQKGKRVRPILVFLSAEICGGVQQKTYRGATLVEILHTATLVHDDVVTGDLQEDLVRTAGDICELLRELADAVASDRGREWTVVPHRILRARGNEPLDVTLLPQQQELADECVVGVHQLTPCGTTAPRAV